MLDDEAALVIEERHQQCAGGFVVHLGQGVHGGDRGDVVGADEGGRQHAEGPDPRSRPASNATSSAACSACTIVGASMMRSIAVWMPIAASEAVTARSAIGRGAATRSEVYGCPGAGGPA